MSIGSVISVIGEQSNGELYQTVVLFIYLPVVTYHIRLQTTEFQTRLVENVPET